MNFPEGKLVKLRQVGVVVEGCDDGSEEFGATGQKLRAKVFDEVGDVPRDGHVACYGKFGAGEEGFELAEEIRVRLRFE